MALPRPTIDAITRTGAAGVVSISGTGGSDAQAFILNLAKQGNNVIDGDTRSGDGDIALDLTSVTFTLFGWTVEAPYGVIVATTDGVGNYSLPSQQCSPPVLKSVAFAINNLKRAAVDHTKIEFVVTGLPDPSDEYKLVAIWQDRDEQIYAEGVSADNGKKTLTSNFDLDWAYSFIFMGTDPAGSWLLPMLHNESWVLIGAQAPALDRVVVDDDTRQLQAFFTEPVTRFQAESYVMYRDMTIAEKTWRVQEAAQSPAVLNSLDRGHVYQIQMVTKDARGKFSTPSATIETRVMG